MFEFFYKKIALQNIVDKMWYSGSEGSAIDIIRAIRKELGETDKSTYKKDQLVKTVAEAFKNVVNYQGYVNLKEAERRELKSDIAKALAKIFNTLPSIEVTENYICHVTERERQGCFPLLCCDPVEEVSSEKTTIEKRNTFGLTSYQELSFDPYPECSTTLDQAKFPEIFYTGEYSGTNLSQLIKDAIPKKFENILKGNENTPLLHL